MRDVLGVITADVGIHELGGLPLVDPLNRRGGKMNCNGVDEFFTRFQNLRQSQQKFGLPGEHQQRRSTFSD